MMTRKHYIVIGTTISEWAAEEKISDAKFERLITRLSAEFASDNDRHDPGRFAKFCRERHKQVKAILRAP